MNVLKCCLHDIRARVQSSPRLFCRHVHVLRSMFQVLGTSSKR